MIGEIQSLRISAIFLNEEPLNNQENCIQQKSFENHDFPSKHSLSGFTEGNQQGKHFDITRLFGSKFSGSKMNVIEVFYKFQLNASRLLRT